MKAITLRNMSKEVARAIERRAAEAGVSLNRAVLDLLEEAITGRAAAKRRAEYHDLDELAGRWSAAEARAFDAALAEQRSVDAELWR